MTDFSEVYLRSILSDLIWVAKAIVNPECVVSLLGEAPLECFFSPVLLTPFLKPFPFGAKH